jgi:hypothetical protein
MVDWLKALVHVDWFTKDEGLENAGSIPGAIIKKK